MPANNAASPSRFDEKHVAFGHMPRSKFLEQLSLRNRQIFRHLIKLPVIAKCSSVVICRYFTRMSRSYRVRGPKSLISDEETNRNHCTLQKIIQILHSFQTRLWKLRQQRRGWSNRIAPNRWGSIDLYRGQIQTRPHWSDASTSSGCPKQTSIKNDGLTSLFVLRKEAPCVVFPSQSALLTNALRHLHAGNAIFVLRMAWKFKSSS